MSRGPCSRWDLSWPWEKEMAEQSRDNQHLHVLSSSSRPCKGQVLELKQEKMNETILNPPLQLSLTIPFFNVFNLV